MKNFLQKVANCWKLKPHTEKLEYPPNNLFKLINLNENRLSAFYAYLLDPVASHGCGNLFLDEFCKQLKEKEFIGDNNLDYFRYDELSDNNLKINTEYSFEGDHSRIDILLEND